MYLLHFAMLKECPKNLLVLPEGSVDDLDENVIGLFDTSNSNIKIWISGVGCNNVLYPDLELSNLLKNCKGVYSFGLAGSINDNLKVGDFVNVHTVNNLDVNIPGFSMCSTGDKDADSLGCSRSTLLSLSDFNTRVLCYTSNRFVTRDYLDFILKDSGETEYTFYYDAHNYCIDENLVLDALLGNTSHSDPTPNCVVCDMELFYLRRLVDLFSFCSLYSYKMVSDVVCKPDNYKDYEGSFDTVLSKLYYIVNSVFKELSKENDYEDSIS